MLFVEDVEKTSRWYQDLLGCKSNHGGDEFDRLVNDEGNVVLLMTRGGNTSPVTDVLLYFHVRSIDEIYQRAQKLGLAIDGPPRHNGLSHRSEFEVLDPNGFRVVVCQ
jgi:predicted enzyme related to lactoylglutathione lyase